jgi:hypothetical protein
MLLSRLGYLLSMTLLHGAGLVRGVRRGGCWRAGCGGGRWGGGRGLHSSTFQLNLSALYGIRGARRGCVARVKGMFRVCRVLSCDRHGSS